MKCGVWNSLLQTPGWEKARCLWEPVSTKAGRWWEQSMKMLRLGIFYTWWQVPGWLRGSMWMRPLAGGSWRDHSMHFLFELRSYILSKWDGTVAGGRMGLNEWVGILRSLFCKAGPKPEVTPPDPWCLLGNIWRTLLSGPEPRHENRGKEKINPNFIT